MEKFTVEQLAHFVGGSVEGDGTKVVTGVAPVDLAGSADLTYVVSATYARRLEANPPAAALIPFDLEPEADGTAFIRVENPELAFGQLLAVLFPSAEPQAGVHSTATVGPGVRLGTGVSIGPYVTIEEAARIGDGTTIGAYSYLGPGVIIGSRCGIDSSCSILEGAVLGDRVRLHSGARISVDGFGYTKGPSGTVKIPQVGRCVIGDDVEIGANTTIDRGSLGDTEIGYSTKIDNLVHIGHNCSIGHDCFVAAQVGLAGSSIVEDGVQLAGQVGLAGHLRVGAAARIAAQSGVMGDIPAGETWSGYPARPHRMWLRSSSAFYKLPQLVRRLAALEKRPSAKEEE
jgi:UDP-3-O-[3-hydroxymyristoyl] glucosamine N-acyltransferase